MAGKPKKPGASHANWGGSGRGGGRKPMFELSDAERRQIIKDVQREAKENNTTFGQELARFMFRPKGDERNKLAAMRMYVNDVLAKTSERDVTHTHVIKPEVFLPEPYASDEAPDYKVN